MNERYKHLKYIADANAGIEFSLQVLGDQIAKREQYKGTKGIDSARYFLMVKHGWLPSQVRAMSIDDLHFAFSEELALMKFPASAKE